MATKRIDDGARWLAEALRRPDGTQARRARASYDHGYLERRRAEGRAMSLDEGVAYALG